MAWPVQWLRTRGLLGAVAGLALAGGVWAAVPAQPTYASADDAAAALVAAARSDDVAALHRVLGPGSETLISSGDRHSDEAALRQFVESYDAYHALLPVSPERVVLDVGTKDWQLPIPLVQQGGRWSFNSREGAQEIIDRRVGLNELAAVRVSLFYVDAQKDYFERMKQETGTGSYAERLVSTPGQHNGLYWAAADGQDESPLQPLVSQAQDEGYPGQMLHQRLAPYQGYFFRILYSQTVEAPGGAKNYRQNGQMVDGFAMIAWPASYPSSGIMSFMVNQDGILFQKDLGPRTASLAGRIAQFDVDPSWARVDVTDQ
jgi:hypothetical protein